MPRVLTPADLPDILPIFPLQGALLLPGGNLPLNIFEPRYLAMTEEALAGARLIGMIQPRLKERIAPDDSPETYETGCAGRVMSFQETDDGRYLINLKGVCRFSVRKELELTRGYRRVEPDFGPWLADLEAPASAGDAIDRERLLTVLRQYLDAQGLKADWQEIEGAPSAELVSVLSVVCPFSPAEKQLLLEAADPPARAGVILSLMEMQLHDHGEADPAADARAVRH